MNAARNTARIVGVFFILTFITSIAAALLYGPAIDNPTFILGQGADGNIRIGAALEVFLIITNMGCAVALVPLLKRQSESLALGYVIIRLVECVFILVGLLSMLAVVSLHQQAAASTDPSSFLATAQSFVALNRWTFLLGPGFSDGVGTGLILGWLMYRSGIVHRPMALFGVVGGPLLAASGLAVLAGVIPQGSPIQSLATLPEIVWEAYLGLWLTFKGFKAARVAILERREQPAAPAYAAA